MKRIVCRIVGLLLLILVCLSLTGCTNKRQKWAKELIESIDLYDSNPLSSICRAEEVYSELSEKEREKLNRDPNLKIKLEEFNDALENIDMYITIDLFEETKKIINNSNWHRTEYLEGKMNDVRSTFSGLSKSQQSKIVERYKEDVIFRGLLFDDIEIRSSIEDGSCGFGNKFAVYDESADLYYYDMNDLPIKYRATTPEEIMGFIQRHYNGFYVHFVLDNLNQEYSHEHSLYKIVEIDQIPDEAEWMQRVLVAESLNRETGEIVFPEGGTKIVLYDEVLERYGHHTNNACVPDWMYAKSVNEIGYIFSYYRKDYTDVVEYMGVGEKRVPCERMTMRLIKADTGEILAEEELHTFAPTVWYEGSKVTIKRNDIEKTWQKMCEENNLHFSFS